MLIAQALASNLSKGATKPSLVHLGKEITLGDLTTWVARLSYLLQKEIGMQKRVAFVGSNSPAMVASLFALSNTRSILIPVDPDLSDFDIQEWLYETEPTHVMATSDQVARVRDLIRRGGFNWPVIEIEKKRGGEYDKTYVPPSDNIPVDQDPVLLLRTAGTAGKYKYALFNHLQIQGAVSSLKRLYRCGPEERFLTTLNWAHPFAFVHGMLFPVLSGLTCLVDYGLEGRELLDFILKSKTTRLVGFPDFFYRTVILCKSTKRLLAGVKSIIVGMGALSPELCKIYGMMKVRVTTCYGQTENLWTISMSDALQDGDGVLPIQRALSGVKYKLVDDQGDPVEGKGAREGRLAIMGPSVMMRYFHKDKDQGKNDTLEVIRGTWLYTEDIFRMEEAGGEESIRFLRRRDGFKPAPKCEDAFNPGTIADAARKIEGVQEVVAFRNGEGKFAPIICAVVLADLSQLTPHQVLRELSPRLAPRNTPSQVIPVASIPRDDAGKPQMDLLIEICCPKDAA